MLENYIDSFDYFNESVAISEMELDADMKFESSMIDIDYVTESSGVVDRIGSMISKAVEGLGKMIQKIIDFIQSKVFKTKINKAEEAINNNPSLKNTKVKIKDYDKLDKLNQKVKKELPKSKDPEALMGKYRKQRNVILAASAAVAVTLGGLLLWTKKTNAESLNAMSTECTKNLNSLRKVLETKQADLVRVTYDRNQLGKKYDDLDAAYGAKLQEHKRTKEALHKAENRADINWNLYRTEKDSRKNAIRERDIYRDANDKAVDKWQDAKKQNEILSGTIEVMKNQISDTNAKLHQAATVLSGYVTKDIENDSDVKKFAKGAPRTSGMSGRDFKKSQNIAKDKVVKNKGVEGILDRNGNPIV